jgi:predicted amino acid dehydrogenase
MKTYSKMFLSVLLLTAFTASFATMHFACAQTDQTESKLQAASTAVNQAFNAVSDAEKAGANVTGLLAQLNVVAGDLAQAKNSYRTGDSNAALAQATIVLAVAQEVTSSAQDAKQSALVSGQNGLWLTLVFTVIAGLVFVLVLFWVWRWFKRRYIESLSEAKPEVCGVEVL